MSAALRALALLALLASAAQAQAAEVLPDPTRPPAGIPLAAGDAGMPGEPVLQSVLLAGDRSLAVIDGVTVPLGGRYGEAKLVKVSEGQVVLQRPGGAQVLRLYPTVELKRVAGDESSRPAAPRGKKK
jgi:MSHA biogenesis protein MshK